MRGGNQKGIRLEVGGVTYCDSMVRMPLGVPGETAMFQISVEH